MRGTLPGAGCLEGLDVLVLAGGLGLRMREALDGGPKLLAPVAGRPFLAYLLDWLAGFGARRIVFALGYGAEAVLDHLAQVQRPGLVLESVVEPQPLGTAGAIRFARSRLSSDPVLVANGDSFVDADLSELVERHRKAGALGTLLCTEVEDAGRYGRVVIDAAGRIAGFVEKGASHLGGTMISAGVYLFSRRLLDEIAAGTAASLERDVFERLPAGSLAALAGRYRFIDIGTPESFARAAEMLGGLVPEAAAANSGGCRR
ncbi:MAG TPA: nucleotidyltransferase family protein [Alphaproteobacteria bacterium]|nr:nucleotidyltransferase family protein [Alphaproteobacteria bacterium]